MKKLKCIFIGFGKHAEKYAEVCKYLNIEIRAICVNKPEKYIIKKKQFNIQNIYINYIDLLTKENYDFVMVFLPWDKIDKHLPSIIKNTKKNIFCEKPVALSLKKILRINSLSLKYKKKIFVLYNRRFYKIFDYIKKKLKNNKLIKFTMNISERENQLIKLHSTKIRGKLKYHITSHWIDLVMWLFSLNRLKIDRNKKKYVIKFNKKKIYNNIYLDYHGNGPIKMSFFFKTFRYELITLEKLYILKKNKKKLILNENKENKFKPGVLNIVKIIKKINQTNTFKHELPNISDLINLYKNIQYIKN